MRRSPRTPPARSPTGTDTRPRPRRDPIEAADGRLAQRLASGPCAAAHTAGPSVWSHLRPPSALRLCLQFPASPRIPPCLPVSTAVSGFLLCRSVTFSLPLCVLLSGSPSLHLVLFPLGLSVPPLFSVPWPPSPLPGEGPSLTRQQGRPLLCGCSRSGRHQHPVWGQAAHCLPSRSLPRPFTCPVCAECSSPLSSLPSFGLAGLWFSWPVCFRLPAPVPSRSQPSSLRVSASSPVGPLSGTSRQAGLGGDQRWPQVSPPHRGLGHGRSGPAQHWVSWACQLGCGGRGGGKGGSPLPAHGPPLPSHSFPFVHFPRLPLPLLFTLSKYSQAVIMGPESSHTHRLPLVSAPQPAAGPAPRSPLPPQANESQMAPGDSATGLWEPRRPAFPCPHTQLMLP